MFARLSIASLLVSLTPKPVWSTTVSAYSRSTWRGRDGNVIRGRSMGWLYDFNSRFDAESDRVGHLPAAERRQQPRGTQWVSPFLQLPPDAVR